MLGVKPFKRLCVNFAVGKRQVVEATQNIPAPPRRSAHRCWLNWKRWAGPDSVGLQSYVNHFRTSSC
jgi:hypothetical protein